jgi:phage gp36-like protein
MTFEEKLHKLIDDESPDTAAEVEVMRDAIARQYTYLGNRYIRKATNYTRLARGRR